MPEVIGRIAHSGGLRLAVIAWATMVSARALAEVTPEDAARAAALFADARKLIDAGQVDAACAKFDASIALDPQLGSELNAADCHERQGQLVAASEGFERAAADAARAADGREAYARTRLAALTAKLVRVTVRIADPSPPGLTLKLGARVLQPAEWSTPRLVEPGRVVLEVTAPDRKPVRVERDGVGGGELALEVPALEPAQPTGAGGETPNEDRPQPGRSLTPYLVGGAGAALLVGATGLGLHAKSRYDQAVTNMNEAALQSAQHQADLATAVAIAGGVAVGVGAWLYFKGRRGRDHVVVTPTTTGTAVELAVTGSF